MKKVFSLLLCVVMVVSVFSATAFAAQTPLFSIASVSKTEVTTNDEVVVTLAHAEQPISSLAAYLEYDPAVLELVSIYDGYGEPAGSEDVDFGMWYTTKKYMDVAVGAGAAGKTVYFNGNLNGETKTVTGNETYCVITFKVIATSSTTTTVNMREGWDYTETEQVKQLPDTLVDSETITVTVAAPEPDLEKKVEGGTLDAVNETKTYELTVGADLKDTGVTAVLTHEDYPEDPQEVGLTFSGWAGEAKAVFNVVVKFLDYTANASKVSLSIK